MGRHRAVARRGGAASAAAQGRKPRHPLHVLVLRVYRIPRPVTVRVRPEYEGCMSWVEIDRELPFEGTPVIADEEFERAAAAIGAVVRDAGVLTGAATVA